MEDKEVFKIFEVVREGRKIIKRVVGLCEVCKEEYWLALLEDGAVLTFHERCRPGFRKDEGCYNQLWKISKELRAGVVS